MLVLVILAVVWAAVLVPPFVRNRRDGRPDNSVVSFRAQLSTLERATPGTSLRSLPAASHGGPALPLTMNRTDAKRRRRDILVGLLGATVFTLLLAVVVGGAFTTLLFLASGGALGAYVYALRQMKLRTLERVAKVRPLSTARSTPAPVLAMRRTAN